MSDEREMIETPRDLLESFVNYDECWFDHAGGCQAHGYISLEPGEICPQKELKTLLSRWENEGGRCG